LNDSRMRGVSSEGPLPVSLPRFFINLLGAKLGLGVGVRGRVRVRVRIPGFIPLFHTNFLPIKPYFTLDLLVFSIYRLLWIAIGLPKKWIDEFRKF
jgi:hypothetical protein